MKSFFKHKFANRLTVFRFFISFFFIAFMVFENPYCKIIALFLFSLAGLTDWYDGKIAREQNQESDYGRVVDPLADKVITVTAYIFFVKEVSFYNIPAWLVSLIIIREFTISSLRTLALYYKTEVVTSKLGKFKTISQFVAIISILLLTIINLFISKKLVELPEILQLINNYVPITLMGIVFITTWISGLDYIIKNKKIVYDIGIK